MLDAKGILSPHRLTVQEGAVLLLLPIMSFISSYQVNSLLHYNKDQLNYVFSKLLPNVRAMKSKLSQPH